MTDRFLDDGTLWDTLSRLAKAAKMPKFVAAPYLGENGAKSLHLGNGDVLVVALTLENCRSGSVCPKEIRKLQRMGVRVYIGRNLHAKVYLFGDVAVVCSANMSSNSKNLDEAGLLTRDRDVLRQIRDWFGERTGVPVLPAVLAACEKAYRPPKFGPGKNQRQDPSVRLWILGTTDIAESAREAGEIARGEARAQKKLTDRRRTAQGIYWPGTDSFTKNVRVEDLVIVVHNDREVYPHAPVLRVRRTRRGPQPEMYVYLAALKDAKPGTWASLRKACKDLGFRRLGRTITSREVENPRVRAKLTSIMSPERWAT